MIKKLLIANRGEIAVRVMRSAHQAGISCVALYSDPDASALHVSLADVAVRLPGSAPADTYLRSDLVVEAALRTGSDAVHPGYGFLSENAEFAKACADAGLTFVGPPASVIAAMGSKLAAKQTMASAGVPVLPQVEVRLGGSATGSGSEPDPSDLRDLADRVASIGYPVLVKASAGGGGRGMRIVEDPSSLESSVQSAHRESLSAFGDGTLFIEPYARRPRHIEVQVIGDTHGNVVHLFERECSIQRRHQKIVEESPSAALSEQARAEICETAVLAAKAIGYVNAGTVEFLMLEDGSFAFLEVNTRLQVEHPVTEFVTGLDLVRLQLLVAEGRALPSEAMTASQNGHAIEVRLYAEDPTQDWRPSVGRIHAFDIGRDVGGNAAGGDSSVASGGVIRVDTGVVSGSVVSPWYDPMLAKVISFAPTRDEAARSLAYALARSHLHGITTNRDLLVRILRHPEFLAGEIDTAFLVRNDPAQIGAPLASPDAEKLHAIVAALAQQASRRHEAQVAGVLGGLPSGYRNNPSEPQRERFAGSTGELEVTYRFDRSGRCVEVECRGGSESSRGDKGEGDNSDQSVGTIGGLKVITAESTKVTLVWAGILSAYDVSIIDDVTYVDGPDGASTLTHVARFPLPGSQLIPGSLVAPLPGTVVRVQVKTGDHVEAGQTLVAIEAMKMEHEIRTSHAGTVTEVAVTAGDQVDSGRLLVVVADVDEAPNDAKD